MPVTTALPKRLSDHVVWLGDCLKLKYMGRWLHAYHSVFLAHGEVSSVLVDCGAPKDWHTLERQLDRLDVELPPIRYIFPTHAEVPHSSALHRLAVRYPEATVVGDLRDYHYAFPGIEDRLTPHRTDEWLDLGGSRFYFAEGVIKDNPTTLWGYLDSDRCLFPADGFAYMHHHASEECGAMAEEMHDLPLEEFTSVFAMYALHWTRYTDLKPHLARLDALLEKYPTDIVAPAHGAPIVDPAETIPKVKRGLILGSLHPEPEGAVP